MRRRKSFGARDASEGCRFVTLSSTILLLLLAAAVEGTSLASSASLQPSEKLTEYGCENTTLTIECRAGTSIKIIRANFGRFSISVCNELGNTTWSVNCHQPRTHRVINARCDSRPRCQIPVDAALFGDPCPGTSKYVEVHYTCQSAEQATTTPKPIPPWLLDLAATPATVVTTPKPTTTTTTAAAAPTTTTTAAPTSRSAEQDAIALKGDASLTGHCQPRTARNLFWNWTEPGGESVQPCPAATNGFSNWRCGFDGQWEIDGPDLSKCQSLWLGRLESRIHAGGSIDSIGSELAALTETKSVYGGDIPVVSRLLQGLVHKLGQDLYLVPTGEEKEMKASELLQNVLKTASNLLDVSQFEAWGDVSPEQRAAFASNMMLGVEETAMLLAETINNEKSLVEDTNNVVSSIRIMRRKAVKDQVFPNADSARWGDDSSLHMPATTLAELGENGAVRVFFALYNNLEKILPGRGQRFLNSRVMSATSSKERNQKVSWPINFSLKHLNTSPTFGNPMCGTWDFGRKRWSLRDCAVVKTNATHTQCRCRKISVYAILAEEVAAVTNAVLDESNEEGNEVEAVPQGSATSSSSSSSSSSNEMDSHWSTIIAAVVALVAVIIVLVVAAVLAKRFDLKPRMQKFVQASSGSTSSSSGESGGSGGVFRCKKSESSTSSCGFYPPLTSSPTSTNVSSGTPTNQTTYLEQVLKAHGIPPEQVGEYQQQHQVQAQTAMPQAATMQRQDLPGGTIYRPTNLSGIQPQHVINHGGRQLVALNQYDPFGHHIYMEIDPVYARLDAAVAAAAAAAANNNHLRGGNNLSSGSSVDPAAHSDIQLSDISDDDPRQQPRNAPRFAAAEERPLIRRSTDLVNQPQNVDAEGNFVMASPGPRQFLTSQRLQQHREQKQQQNVGNNNNNGSLRSGRTGQRPRLQQQQQPLLYPVVSSQSPTTLEDPISIALQGGEQFVSLKIDQQKRQQKRQQQKQQHQQQNLR